LAFVLISGCDRSSSSSTSNATSSSTPTPAPTRDPIPSAAPVASVETVTLPDTFIADDAPTIVHVGWKIPPGTGINDDAPFKVHWTTSEGLSEVPPEAKTKGADVRQGFDVEVAPMKGEPAAHLAGNVDVVVCDVETHKVCVPVKRKIEVTFAVQKGAKRKTSVDVPLPAARPAP
jgi:hypothetical protein